MYHSAQLLYTTQHRTVLIIFPLILQTIIIAQDDLHRPSTLLEKFSWKRMSLRAELERKRTYAMLSDDSIAVVGAVLPQTVTSTSPVTPATPCIST